MNNQELYQLLDLPKEVIKRLNACGETRNHTFHVCVSDLIKDIELTRRLDQLITDAVGEDPDGMKTLWEDLNIARDAFDEYQKKGIPVTVFTDTMKFCTRFLTDYHKTHACYRFQFGWWFPRQLSLREFRIGALEYEYGEEGYIEIHIPSDADISEASVLESLSQFKLFCRQYYPAWENLPFRCQSWLLSPALKELLDDTSKILAFQKLFDIVETDYESMAALDWVFPGHDKVSADLPEHTGLQKKMKKYLLEGKSVGWTTGLLRPL